MRVDMSNQRPVSVPDVDRSRNVSLALDRFGETELPQCGERIRRQAERKSNLVSGAGALQHPDGPTRPSQNERDSEPADARADDDRGAIASRSLRC